MNSCLTLEMLPGNLALLMLDAPGQEVNTFSAAAIQELTACVAGLAQRTDVRGLLVASGKPGQFVAGADLKELADFTVQSRAAAEASIASGHRVFTALSNLPFPTVALINGACMGSGTEMVLSLDYRLAANIPQVKIGLPEVKIGLIPGWGGTQRLPRLVGVTAGIELITSGEPVDAKRAVEIGLVYDAVPLDRLVAEGTYLIDEAHRTGEWQKLRQQRRQPLGLSEDQLQFAFGVAEAAVAGKSKGQYPAPVLALRVVREGINCTLEDGLAIEQSRFHEVLGTPISSNLIVQYFTTTRLQRESGVDDPAVTPRTINTVGVLGAGLMGAGIAAAHARRSVTATMVDVDTVRVEDGLKRARKTVEDRIAIGRATSNDLVDMLQRISGTTSRLVFKDCDLVVEAVTENEQLKTKIIAELADVMRPDAILASNTSTISITRLAKAWPAPERFVGMHFFSPVDRMPLVEVVRGELTSDETVATIVALAKRIGKTPIVVRDCPGFLVNRVLMPYMAEALVLLENGIDMDRIDKIATRWGMPVGPITLYDMIGLDTGLYAGEVLLEGYSGRAVATSKVLTELVQRGRLGKKSGKGFRGLDRKGKFVADPEVQQIVAANVTERVDLSDDDIADRMFICMALEAIRAMEDNITRQPGDLDMAMLLGTNFPGFRGGPLRWCDTEGAVNIVRRAEKWLPLGARFAAPAALTESAKSGTPFYQR